MIPREHREDREPSSANEPSHVLTLPDVTFSLGIEFLAFIFEPFFAQILIVGTGEMEVGPAWVLFKANF